MLLAFFFQLATEPEYVAEPAKVLEHPVLGRLSRFKAALEGMKALGLGDEDEDIADDREMAGIMGPPTAEDLEYEELGSLEPNELEDLLEDEKENQVPSQDAASSDDAPNAGSAAPDAAPQKSAAAARKKSGKKAKQAEQSPAQDTLPLSSIAEVEAEDFKPVKTSRRRRNTAPNADSFGEADQLHDHERAEKQARRQIMQFRAEQAHDNRLKPNKLEGDSDIPYRDRQRSRDAVSAANANKLNKQTAPDTSLNELEWGDEDWQARKEAMQDADDASDDGSASEDGAYYDLVQSGRKAAKKSKKREYDEARNSSRVWDDEPLAEGEHRTINRTIEKNRGLTPARARNIQNPRVKRRRKFDRAQKRLSSTRAVYKGGQSALQGGYAGEQSGISTRLVKSRKLGS